MNWSLIGSHGGRKYLTMSERAAFIRAAKCVDPLKGSFCLTLALTGARISEVMMLSPDRVDRGEGTVIFETLKRRRKGVYRAVPVPSYLLSMLDEVCAKKSTNEARRIWTFSRPTAWKYVKNVMHAADVPAIVATPRALRHAFAVEGVQKGIALNLIRKWLGHAKIETTAIYADAIGDEERSLARLMWNSSPAVRRML